MSFLFSGGLFDVIPDSDVYYGASYYNFSENETVSTLEDLVGGADLAQGNGATFETFNTNPSIRFDNADNDYFYDDIPTTYSPEWTVIIAVRPQTTTGYDYILSCQQGSGDWWFASPSWASGGDELILTGPSGTIFEGNGHNPTGSHVYVLRLDSNGDLNYRYDGIDNGTQNLGLANFGPRLLVGEYRVGDGRHIDMNLFEILFKNEYMSNQAVQDEEQRIAGEYSGISLA